MMFTNSGLGAQASCSAKKISLYALSIDGTINYASPARTVTLNSDGSFEFKNLKSYGIDPRTSQIHYILRAEACGENYSRPLTGLHEQNITVSSSLFEKINAATSSGMKKLNQIDTGDIDSLLKNINQINATTISQAYDAVLTDSVTKNDLQTLFNISYEDVKDLTPPDIQSFNKPTSYAEASQASFSVVASHWYKSFLFAYEWSLNGTVVSHSFSYSFVPTKNYQGTQSLLLKVGVDNGSGGVDFTKPYVTQTLSVEIPNTFPAIVPGLTLVSPAPTNSLNVNLALATGSGMMNCDTFTALTLTENVALAPLSPSSYTLNCTAPISQALNYTLSMGDGLKTLRLWAMDSAGNISSTPQTVNVLLDQTAPVITFTPISGVLKGGASYTLNFTTSDATSGIDSATLYFAQDGSSFVSVADIKGLSSYNWTIPSLDVSTAKFKIVAVDKAGNSATVTSNAMTIDSTAPTVAITSPAANSYINISNVSTFNVSGSCSEEGRNVVVNGMTALCSSGIWSASLNLTTTAQGSIIVSATQDDAAGNTKTVTTTYLKDTVAPTISITSPNAGSYINIANVSAITVSGVCSENGQTITFSGDASGTVACSSGVFSKVLNFTTAPQGAVTLNAAISDVAGNSISASKSYVKDTIAPVVTVTTALGDINSVNYKVYALTGSCSESGILVSISADGSTLTANCSGGSWSLNFDFTGSPEGPVTITAAQTDVAGNSGAGTLSLNKSTGLPSLGITSPAANSYVNIANASSFTLNGNCSANGNAVNVTGPVTATTTCSGNHWTVNLNLTSLSDADFTVSYNHSDSSGNTATATRIFKKDTVAPAMAITAPAANSYINISNVGTFTISGTCSENTQTVSITGAATGTATCASGIWSASLNFSAASDGTVSITTTHSDVAGNQVSDTRTFIKDTLEPILAISTPAANSYINASSVASFTVMGTCSENARLITVTGDATGTFTCSGGAWAGNLNFSAAAQGSIVINLSHSDIAGNSSSVSRSFIKDTVLPLITLSSPANGAYINASNAGSYTFSGTCSENGQSVNITGSAASSTTCTSGSWLKTMDLSSLSDGVVNFTVGISDVAGNAASSSVNLNKDVILPSVTLTSYTGGQVIAGGSVANITWTGSDNNALPATPVSIDYSTNSGSTWSSVASNIANSGSYSWSTPVITSGSVRFRLTIKDSAGNIKTAASASDVAINSTPPTISLTSLTGGQYLSGGSAQNITWSATGTYLGSTPIKIEFSSDSGASWNTLIAATTNTGTYSWSVPTVDASTYRARVTVTDQAGLSSTAASTSNIIIDNTDPVLTLSKPSSTDNIAGGSSFYINWNATDTNFGSTPLKFEYSINSGSTWTTIVSATSNAGNYLWTVPTLDSTNVTLRATTTDLAGRQKQVTSAAFTVDSTPPNAPTMSLSSAAVTNTQTVTLNVTCISDYAKVLLTESSSTPTSADSGWQNCASSMNFTISTGDGNHTIKIWSKDVAGNISTSSGSVAVNLDQTSPTLSFDSTLTGLTLKGGGVQNLAWTANDAHFSGTPIKLEYSANNGTSWTTIASLANSSPYSWSIPSIDSNQVKIRVTATDSVGNPSTTVISGAFTIDSTGPSISSMIINDGTGTAGSTIVGIKMAISDNFSTGFQVRFAETTSAGDCQSLFSDDSWVPWVNATTNISYNLSPVDGTKKICAWAKDAVGNFSSINPSTCSLGVNCNTVDYFVGNPPVITSVNVTNNTSGVNLGTTTYNTGDAVLITWTMTDVEGLSNSPVTIYYQQNGGTWNTIVSNYGSLSGNPTTYTGSYSGFTAPSGTFRLKLVAKDSNGNTSVPALSNTQNTPGWQIYLGSKDVGLGGKALGVSISKSTYGTSQNQFAVNPTNGDIYAISSGYGIYKLDAKTGVVTSFLTEGAPNLVNGGALASTLYGYSGAMGVNFDKKGRLYISNPENTNTTINNVSVKIWQIDLTQNKSYLYAGGGTLPGTGSTLPSDLTQVHISQGGFELDDNGNLYFMSDCQDLVWTSGVFNLHQRLLKLTQNTDGTAGSLSILAGNCSTTNLTNGADPLSGGLGGLGYKHLTQISTNSDGSIIYLMESGLAPSTTAKLVNTASGYKIYTTTLSTAGLAFDRVHNLLYSAVGGTVYKSTLAADPTAAETTTIYASKTGTGDCNSDGTLATNACINAVHGNGPGAIELNSSGTLLFADTGFRIRYVDSNNKLRTLMGTKPFFGEGLDKSLVRGNFRGLYYKTSDLATDDFPKGLYFMDYAAGIMGYVDPNTNIVSTVFGNQEGTGPFPVDNSVLDKYTNVTNIDTQYNYNGLKFDSDGYPVFIAKSGIVRLGAGRRIKTLIPGSGGTYWFNSTENSSASGINMYPNWGVRNFEVIGNNFVYSLGHLLSTTVNPSNNSAIGYFDITNSKLHFLMKGITSSASTAAAPDSTDPATVRSSGLAGKCYNMTNCFLYHNSTSGIMYYSEGNIIRALSSPTDNTAVTLSSPANMDMGRALTNFTFSPDNTRIYYISTTGSLYCKYIGTGSIPANCQNTSLGPPAGISSLAAIGGQLTWIQDGQLLIGNAVEVYLYSYTP